MPTTDWSSSPPVRVSGDVPEAGRFRTLLTGRLLAAMILFCLAGVCGQTLVYGLNTWLPQLMVIAKYSLASSLTFLLTVNIGAVVGVLVSSRLADRFGPRPVTATAFASSGIALVLMGTGIMPLPAMYLLVAVVGFGSVGAQILVNGFVATYFSGATRATALGITLGIGRIGAVLAISGDGVLVAASLGTFGPLRQLWASSPSCPYRGFTPLPQRPARARLRSRQSPPRPSRTDSRFMGRCDRSAPNVKQLTEQ